MNLGAEALGSRPVLRIKPEGRQLHPVLDAETARLLEAVDALSSADALSAEVLRTAMGAGIPAVTVSAAEKAAELMATTTTADPVRVELALTLLVALASDLDEVADVARDGLDLLSSDQRDTLLERGLSSTLPDEQRGAALAWPRLLPTQLTAEARAARITALLERLPPALAFGAAAENCAELPASVLTAIKAHEAPAARAAGSACDLAAGAQDVPEGPLLALLDAEAASAGAVARVVARYAHRLGARAKDALATALAKAAEAAFDGDGARIGEARAALGVADGFATLAVLLRAGPQRTRRPALEAVIRLGERQRLTHPSLAAALERAAEAPDGATRALVAEALGLLDDGRVVPLLTLLARDGSTEVRVAAAYAAGRSDNDKLAKVLVEHGILDTSDRVRDAAYASLEHLVHGHPLPPPSMVSEWLTHPEPLEGRTFWGRDHVAWRDWYQNP